MIYANGSTGNVGIGDYANSSNKLFVNGNADNSETVLRCKVNYSNTSHGTTIITKAISGISTAEAAFGVGVYGEGAYQGLSGYATGSGNSSHHGVYGLADGTGTGKHIGVYGEASGSNSDNWGGYFTAKVFVDELRVGSELQATGYKVKVDGKVICEELRVLDSGSWPDYVFNEDYKLPSLDDVELHIRDNKHLPGIPSACEVEENGIAVGEMQKKLMEKVEELTLYVIELQKQVTDLKKNDK